MSREIDKYSLDTTSLARTCTQVIFQLCTKHTAAVVHNHKQFGKLESCTSVTQPNPIYPQILVPAVFKEHVFISNHYIRGSLIISNHLYLIITTVVNRFCRCCTVSFMLPYFTASGISTSAQKVIAISCCNFKNALSRI